MGDKFNLLEQKVDQVLELLDKLKAENRILKEENNRLLAELNQVRDSFEEYKLVHADQSNRVKEKLTLVLNRVEELEQIEL
ncbi:MAG: cell division protein ZapB [candidate division Zixibacteria bacterium]|nr:cell division protein ZapB [candidate division Zixibacteria bacterium]